MSSNARTKTEYRGADGNTFCFGTVPLVKLNPEEFSGRKIPKWHESKYLGMPVTYKLDWSQPKPVAISMLFSSDQDIEAAKKLPDFEPV